MKALLECSFIQRIKSNGLEPATEAVLSAEYQIFQSAMLQMLYSDAGYPKIDFLFNDLLILFESKTISKKKRTIICIH